MCESVRQKLGHTNCCPSIFYKERRVLWVHLWIVGNWLGRCNFQSMHFCEKSRLCRIYNFCRNIKVQDMEIRFHLPQFTNCYEVFWRWLHCFSWWYSKWQGKGKNHVILSLPSEINCKYAWRRHSNHYYTVDVYRYSVGTLQVFYLL